MRRYSLILLAVFLCGCAGISSKRDYLMTDLPEPDRVGVYHKVQKGETLWSIAKAYKVTIDDVIRTNRIPNIAQIEEHQLVFIPGAYASKEVVMEKEEPDNGFLWPLKGKVIGYFHERKGNGLNKGIDIQAREGESVKAARRGRVVFADYLTGYGYTVILDHADQLYSVYARNAKLLVKLNDLVHRGDEIALVGRLDNRTYAHFEIRKNAIEDNPLYYLP